MHVLVTRPEPAAAATAAALARLGHRSLVCPVTQRVSTGAAVPDGPYALVIATSAAALSDREPLARAITDLPLIAVGPATARAARNSGFGRITAGPGTADAIVPLLSSALPQCDAGPVLYLAGTPRKPDLETALATAGITVTVCERYRALPADRLDSAVVTALSDGTLDAVLHYSRQSAARFAALCETHGLAQAARRLHHLCLSADVAGGLARLAPDRVTVSPRPDEAALIGQLDK